MKECGGGKFLMPDKDSKSSIEISFRTNLKLAQNPSDKYKRDTGNVKLCAA